MHIAIEGPELVAHADSITPEAACTSVQLHVQVTPVLAQYWNAAQAIWAFRSRWRPTPYLFGKQLWQETRITLFEQATDTRPVSCSSRGCGPGCGSASAGSPSVFDLFEENIRYFPALLPICEDEDPLAELERGPPATGRDELHNGTIYR
jgi:hypothetical protein